jgi:hypothetical protein
MRFPANAVVCLSNTELSTEDAGNEVQRQAYNRAS